MAMKPKRTVPLERMLKRTEVMTRADSLSSIGEFGKVFPPSQWEAERKRRKPKKSWNPFDRIGDALRKK